MKTKWGQVFAASLCLMWALRTTAQPQQWLHGKILYVRHEAKGDALWSVCADGSAQALVGRFPRFSIYYSTPISLSSRRIYVQESLWSSSGAGRREAGKALVSYSLNGSQRRVLKSLPDSKAATFGFFNAVLSPDGKRLAYSLSHSPNRESTSSEVRTIGTDGKGDKLVFRRVAPLEERCAIAWSRDGRSLLLRKSGVRFRSVGSKDEPDWLTCDAQSGKVLSSSSGLLPANIASLNTPLVSGDGAWAIVPGPQDIKAECNSPPQRRDLRTGASIPLAIPVRVGPFEACWSGDGQMFALWWMRTGPTFEEFQKGERERLGPRNGIDIFTREGKRLRTLVTDAEVVAWLP